MAEPHPRDRYPRPPRLDASGAREVVYCHQCENEWYRDEHGLTCPRCDGEATEIISLDNDPRAPPTPELPAHFRDIHDHNPWRIDEDEEVPDPEEGDLEEFIQESPGGHTHTRIYAQTLRSNGLGGIQRGPMNPNDPDNVIRDFQSMMGTFLGPNFRQGPPGRSGPDALYPGPGPVPGPQGVWHEGPPHVWGGTFTFTTGPRVRGGQGGPQTQGPDELATYASPDSSVPSSSDRTYFVVGLRGSPDQLARILAGLFGPMGVVGEDGPRGGGPAPFPTGLRGILANLFNPENAVAGDAVYSQEALDRIISTLMEQHPTSNAPGPASPEAIRSLPKKKLDEKMLGADLKGECSVCMDDVHLDDEVVVLPCNHWFHETCASAWLSEHNTCPICRKGIGDEEAPRPAPGRRGSSQQGGAGQPPPLDPNDPLRASARERMSRRSSRNDAHFEPRDANLLDPRFTEPEYQQPSPSGRRRWQVIGDPANANRSPSPPRMPGSFRRRNSEMSENQREARRGDTSGSDQSRQSTNAGGVPISWLRRFSGGGSGSSGGNGR